MFCRAVGWLGHPTGCLSYDTSTHDLNYSVGVVSDRSDHIVYLCEIAFNKFVVMSKDIYVFY